ncbi:DUF4331 family protein [Pseudomarimonas arenosa]|uniref:DUF4331 family protein n=1 Tax=Pseudomarimonas arenosa TaxID=2774145 RepID=A0AAW3ZNG5_9GAMM|nr:DUF4331 family protein [Pseudomarimonas arenosa]MBD8526177.1 DUF4331 family protein [Pseudomarimonas arenosa]
MLSVNKGQAWARTFTSSIFATAMGVSALLISLPAIAADHRDAPTATADPAADINDIYAFMNPNDSNELVLVTTVVPAADYNSRFSDAVEYRVYINNGAQDLTITCQFTQQSNRVSCAGDGGLSASGGIERTIQGDGMRVFAGLRDDPFFFDGPAFNATRTTLTPSFTNPGFNSFNGNTLALVIGVDKSRLNNGGANAVLKVWAATVRTGEVGVSPGFSGLWFDATQPGFGTHIEVLPPTTAGGPDRVAMTWYTYDTQGRQRWIVGDGTISGNTMTINNAYSTSGGLFPPNFDSSQVTQVPFGSITMSFTDCNTGSLTFTATDTSFGTAGGTLNLNRLTQIKNQPCTFFTSGQVDRMGRPGINTVLINVLPNTGTALKEAYNRSSNPNEWSGLFLQEMIDNATALDTLDGVSGNALLPPATLGSVLVDDRLIIDTSKANCDAYLAVELMAADCGGRTLARDVIDDSLGALVGPGVSDNVANDSVFLSTFPFLGTPL